MALDPRIILMGQAPDVMGAMAQGIQLAAQTNQLRAQNALSGLYQTQGADIMAGKPQALNALAGIDPMAALGVQDARLGMDARRLDMAATQQRMDMLTRQEQQALAEAKARMSAEEAAKAAAEIESAVKMGLAIQDPAQWDALMAQNAPQLVGQFANRQALAMKYMTMAEALKAATPEKVDPIKKQMDQLALEKAQMEVDAMRNPPQAAPDRKAIENLRKEFSGQQLVKNFAVMSDSYGKITAAAKDPSAAGDLALIFSFMKMLDPTSVVREQEFANAQNAAGVPERIRALYNNILSGERLTPSTRADFLKQTDALYQSAEDQYAALERQFKGIAQRENLPVEDVLLDYRYSGQRFTPPPTMGDIQSAGIGRANQGNQPAPQAMQDAASPPPAFVNNAAAKDAAARAGVPVEDLWEFLSPEARARLSQ